MTNKDNGGPAFPVASSVVMAEGMSLRDWFSAQANEADVLEIIFKHAKSGGSENITRQQARYIHADLMLKERAK